MRKKVNGIKGEEKVENTDVFVTYTISMRKQGFE